MAFNKKIVSNFIFNNDCFKLIFPCYFYRSKNRAKKIGSPRLGIIIFVVLLDGIKIFF